MSDSYALVQDKLQRVAPEAIARAFARVPFQTRKRRALPPTD
jgi:hypothetical protein